MGAGGKGGSQTSTVEIPDWLEDAAQANLARADDVSSIGYTPYYGPDVAAFTPMQQASFDNTGAAAGAFGLSSPANPMAGMPQAQEFAGGVQGYSSAPLFQQSLDQLQANNPEQFNAINGMFSNSGYGGAPAVTAQQVPNDPFGADAGGPDNAEISGGPTGQGFGGFGETFGGLANDLGVGGLGIGGGGGMGGGK